ncbi:TetR family transcriptional regulator [Mycobacterium antarcticum]|nr:TetR family transcriptional regulator [Mycolicibacterium sp. TUM20985]
MPSTEDTMPTVRYEALGPTVLDRLRSEAIEHFGRFGFDQSMLEVSIALDVDVSTLSDLFGSINGLRAACDEAVLSSIRSMKTEALANEDPGTLLDQVATIDSFAPSMSYLAQALQAGDELSHTLMRAMIDDAEAYVETAVANGTVEPSVDPKGRARFLIMNGVGGFLLYRQMHPTPTDMGAVLRDYAKDMILPAIELYTHGLMIDANMYEVFNARGHSVGG